MGLSGDHALRGRGSVDPENMCFGGGPGSRMQPPGWGIRMGQYFGGGGDRGSSHELEDGAQQNTYVEGLFKSRNEGMAIHIFGSF